MALFGTDWIDAATVLLVKHRACSIGTILQHQPLAIRRKVRLVSYEVRLAHPKMRGNPRRIAVFESYDSLDATTCPALATDEIGKIDRHLYTRVSLPDLSTLMTR